jgi:phosphatidylglycerol lysyltransferase
MLPDQSFWLASRITVAVALSFLAGWAVVTAVAVIVFDTGGYAGFAWAVLGGAGLVIALWLYGPPAPFRWPNLRTISALTLLCALDTLAAAGALFVLLPVDLGLSLSVLLPAFLLAYGAGLLSGTPGGIGAFELSLLALLPHIPEAPLLAAVLCWRLAYFVLPALLGALAAMRGARWRPITPQPRLLPDMKDCAWASAARAPALCRRLPRAPALRRRGQRPRRVGRERGRAAHRAAHAARAAGAHTHAAARARAVHCRGLL